MSVISDPEVRFILALFVHTNQISLEDADELYQTVKGMYGTEVPLTIKGIVERL